MDQKDKIDLSSVNKTKKQFKITNPFKKNTAGPGRDQFGQFASGGSGLRGKSKWMNWKVLALVVVLVGVVGGFYVYKSNAATGDYTFVRYANQMNGGIYVAKSNGTKVRQLTGANRKIEQLESSTMITAAEVKASRGICTHYTSKTAQTDIRIYIADTKGSTYVSGSYPTSGNNICLSTTNFKRYAPNQAAIVIVSVGCINSGGNDTCTWATAAVNATIDTIYGKAGARSADASCKISTAQATNGTYTATWNSGGIDLSAAEEPLTMRLKNSATGTETPDLPLSGSRALAPKAGANNVYTMTLYEGTEATDLTCTTNINLSPATPPPATTPSCQLSIAKSGTSYTASWLSGGIPSGSNWGSALSRPGGNTALGATTGSATIVPPTGTTTYTLVIYDKNISSTGAMNSWKATCAANVTK